MENVTQDITKIFGPALGPKPVDNASAGVISYSPAVPTSENATPDKVNTDSMIGLAGFVMRHFRINYDERKRNGVEERLKYAIQAQTLKYNDRQRAFLEGLGIDKRVYSPLTAIKIRAAKSMLVELSAYGNEIPFSIEPTPDPDIPKEIADESFAAVSSDIIQLVSSFEQAGVSSIPPHELARLHALIAKAQDLNYDRVESEKDSVAKRRAARLQKKVWDKMKEGDWCKASAECLDYACTYGTAVMVGPIMRNKVKNVWVKDTKSGVRKCKREIVPTVCYEAISPVDCYPSPDAKEVSDGVFCVRVKYTREELWRFRRASAKSGEEQKDSEGWRDNAIAMVLDRNPEFGCRLDAFPENQEVRTAENNGTDSFQDCKFEGVRCFAFVEGKYLRSLGIVVSLAGENIESDGFYYVETIVIDNTVVFVRIHDERIGFPLSKTVFYELPGSWWGESIADKLFVTQTVMNNSVVSLLRNMGPSSAGMMWINDVSRLVDKSSSGLQAEPGKIWAFQSSFLGQSPAQGAPMGVMQIQSNAAELLKVADWASKQADIDSGIPAFSEGTGGSNGGALRTAEGLRTYTEASSRGMKMIVSTNDRCLVTDVAKRTADMILVTTDDVSLRGDVNVVSVGMMGRILKSQNDQARIQLFNLCLNSQLMQQILGIKGIVELFRPSCKDIGINPDNVCPDAERVGVLEELEKLKQLYAATSVQSGVAANIQQAAGGEEGGEGAGMSPGVTPIAQVGGGVSGRRGAA